ncbi:hypothetical protein [Candidatus Reidiella endopervernicosa]|uniref:Type 4 fimbrial biogenesis protein PilX N-terminal domain-containing protein n=1 Tax=Candidatus Reidiella endopervernicosa TaxID=2738883 RepID=A0A6N0HTE5_9GAMM|nr:hypothetical protein [Candidatus Reidiella endopervernicosa]QKQ25467.1 hypothetical protein HUE57_03515 [Candidatus Reidiella endopervernicosa]
MMKSNQQQGFSLIGAIFLMVVLAAVGGYMVSISSGFHISGANAVEGSRAYYAAKGGLEWAISELELDNVAVDSASACSGTVNGQVTNYSSGALDGFSVSLSCSPSGYTEMPHDPDSIFIVEARSYKTALGVGAIGSLGYVSRSMKAKVTDAP